MCCEGARAYRLLQKIPHGVPQRVSHWESKTYELSENVDKTLILKTRK